MPPDSGYHEPRMAVGTSNNTLARDEIYCRNMAALFRVDNRLAQRIDEYEPDGSIVVEAAKTGAPTVSVLPPGSDRPVSLHSKVDPLAEASRFAGSVEVGGDFCYVVSGFGLGHHIKALAGRLKGDAFLVVTEPNLGMLKAALETVDLAELFAKDRCIILTTDDKGEVQTRLEPHSTLMMMGAKFVSHQPSERVAGSFHATLRKMIADFMTYCRMSLVTLVTNSRITCRNITNNLPLYLSTPPIDPLRDRFKGFPGIVVSAGPSLRKNIDQLADLQNRAVLVAVQTTFKTLLDRGIQPHFVTSLDYHEMSKRFFEGVGDVSRTHLVIEPKVTWHVPDHYPGPISVLGNSFARLCVGDSLAARDGLKAGATVAHLAFYLALYMGCDPIILVGQDLAYTNHVYYSPGVAIHGLWRPQLNRFSTIEMMEWERIVRTRHILMKVKDIQGRDIYTDEQLFTYLQQFEGDFSTVPGRVIDATEGGVRKAGTRVMRLAEVAKQYCSRPIPGELLAYRDQTRWHDPSRLEAGRAELRKRIEEVDAMVADCKEMVALLKELETLLSDPAAFNRKIAAVDALRVKIHEHDHAYQMISAVSQHAELQRFSADRRLKLTETEGIELAKAQLTRDLRFVEGVIEGAEALKEILNDGIGRFDRAMEQKTEC